jgi:predicted nucleic acid binding AN1-type Zn finger protein
MSKTITYQCNHCAKQYSSLLGIIEIGSSNNSFFIKSDTKRSKCKEMSNYDDLHFCSQHCLNEFLFIPLNGVDVILSCLKSEKERLSKGNNSAYTDEIFGNVINYIEGSLA